MSTTRTPAADDWRTFLPPRGRFALPDLAEAWRFRDLAAILALRDLRLRYKQTFFGIAWAVLQPLLATALFSLLLGRVVGVPTDGIDYPVFVFAGLAAWWYVSAAVTAAAESLVGDRDLVTKVYFPRLVAPAAALLPGLVDLGLALVIAGVLLAAYGVAPGVAILTLPLWLLALVAVAAAAGLWLSALNVQYRDIRHALGFVLQIWFFTSPIVFASSIVGEGWRYVFALNPLVGVLDGLRWALLDAPAPGAHVAVSAFVVAAALAGGLVYFARVERRFSDVV